MGWYLGHGERPLGVLIAAAIILLTTSLLYWQIGTFILTPAERTTGHPALQNALYYSLISFSSLGYGGWASEPVGWARWAGAGESFLGIFSAVFFSITFSLRITR